MKKNSYFQPLMAGLLCITAVACGQDAKVKTITVINGDTTITETIVDAKELKRLEKEFPGDSTGTRTISKVIVSDGKEGDAMAFSFSVSDDEGEIRTGTGPEKVVVRREKRETSGEKDGPKENVLLKIKLNKLSLHLEMKGSSEPLHASILDPSGKQVFHHTAANGSMVKDIELPGKGVYVLTLLQGDNVTTERIVAH